MKKTFDEKNRFRLVMTHLSSELVIICGDVKLGAEVPVLPAVFVQSHLVFRVQHFVIILPLQFRFRLAKHRRCQKYTGVGEKCLRTQGR